MKNPMKHQLFFSFSASRARTHYLSKMFKGLNLRTKGTEQPNVERYTAGFRLVWSNEC